MTVGLKQRPVFSSLCASLVVLTAARWTYRAETDQPCELACALAYGTP
jgi:hypothetical protein